MRHSLPFLILGLATLGACATQAPPEGPNAATSSAADVHRIAVEQSGQRLDIPVTIGDLTPDAQTQLGEFADTYLRVGHGSLVMSTPSGNANADIAAQLAQRTRMALVEQGVPYSAVAGSTYDASAAPDAPLVLSFTRYEARAPECAPLWEQDLAHQSDNQPWESFGCATQANLAAMIEDPHDLLGPRHEDPRDGGRRATVMGLYRQGDVTHADRSADERIAISNAIN